MGASRKSQFIDRLLPAAADCLARNVRSEDTVTVALSGGVDSVALLHAVRALHGHVAAVHVDHGLSPNSGEWASFCRQLCAEWNVPLIVEQVSVDRASPQGLEAAAREARHKVFASIRCDWVALGHHRGDRAETLLFNLLRGTGVRGAGAMPESRSRLLRPLLPVSRDDIVRYANAHGLSWKNDESNTDLRLTRNFLRHSILPALKRRFPDAESRLAMAAKRFEEAADLLDDLARQDLGALAPEFPLPIQLLSALPEARARNVLRFLLHRNGVGIPSESRLTEAIRQFIEAAPDRHPAMQFGNSMLVRRKGAVVLETGSRDHSFGLPPSS